ncbi:hypothetical protein [Aeromonas cavernicola]|uniref:Uncharacterized protein n=1 Tax=Aeromonas cavernicola TaxID=1006623 RepID=A0A2H9U2Q6_9GAMM|nr:hypothetical protein [Aeromonas cavernicola]PJG58332.1 hypothetical protein CUC53_13170 [Aeromonas cavernicola]
MSKFFIKKWLPLAISLSLLSACNTHDEQNNSAIENGNEIKVLFPTDTIISEYRSYRIAIANDASILPMVGTMHTDKNNNKIIFLQDGNDGDVNIITERAGIFSSLKNSNAPITISLIEPLEEHHELNIGDYLTKINASKIFNFAVDKNDSVTALEDCGLQGRVEDAIFHGVNKLNVTSANCDGNEIDGDLYLVHDSTSKPAAYRLFVAHQDRNIESSYIFQKS